jgi:hypothetical protein
MYAHRRETTIDGFLSKLGFSADIILIRTNGFDVSYFYSSTSFFISPLARIEPGPSFPMAVEVTLAKGGGHQSRNLIL